MAITQEQARAELARRELASRGEEIGNPTPGIAGPTGPVGANQPSNEFRVAARRAGRRDLLGDAMQSTPSGNPLTMAGDTLTAAGGVMQKMESGEANTVNRLMGPVGGDGLIQGDTTNLEMGDVGVAMGMSENQARVFGLATSGVLPGMKAVGKGVDVAATATKNFLKTQALRGVQMGHAIAHKNVEEVAQLAKKGYAQITTDNLDRGAIGLNKIADSVIGDLGKLKEATTVAFRKIGGTLGDVVPDTHSKAVGNALHTLLNDPVEGELVQGVSDAIKKANLRTISQTVKGNTVSKSSEVVTEHLKPVRVGGAPASDRAGIVGNFVDNPQAEKAGALVVDGAGNVSTEVSKTVKDTAKSTKTPTLTTKMGGQVVETPAGLTIPTKRVSSRVATTYSDKTKNVNYTFQNLVDDLNAGKPVTQRDLLGASKTLESLAKNPELNARANKLRTPIEAALEALNPAYARAKAVSGMHKAATDAADELFGGAYKAGTDHKTAPTYATDAERMMKFFDKGPTSPMRTAPGIIDQATQGALGKTTNYADQVADIAATRGVSSYIPKLTGLSVAGGGAVAMVKMGVPAPIIGAGMFTVLALSSPRIGANLGKALYGNSPVQKAVVDWLNKPAGKLFRSLGMQTNQDVRRQLATAPNIVRASVLRGMTGRNDVMAPPKDAQQQQQPVAK